MLFTTPTEWVALGLTLFAGWLFGLASSSGGKKWREQLEEEEVASAANRHEWETALRDSQAEVAALKKQIADAPAPVAAEPSGNAAIPLVAAAGAGAVAATLLSDSKKDEPVVETVAVEPEKTWIPQGPPPPPLAMGTPEPAPYPEPQPIAPDAPPEPTPIAVAPEPAAVAPVPPAPAAPVSAAPLPADVQEEVKAAPTDQSFLQTAPAPAVAAPVVASDTPEPAPAAPVPEAIVSQPAHEWLPPHVRAEQTDDRQG